MTKQLSPAAQAVRTAYYSTDDDMAGPALAAALRAAADQVMPGRPHPHRTQLLAIADELEGMGDGLP